MQINKHKASRLKKKDKCKLVFSRTDKFNDLILSAVSKKEFAKCSEDFLNYKKTAAIWEGINYCIIAYFK
mgnify:CR=1 FL=1